MKLNELRDNPGATKERIRVGRGIGSGKGKTGGRGVKGQKSRSGVAIKAYEGGQMSLYRRLPKRGFVNIFAKDLNELSLGRVQKAIDAGKLDAANPVTLEALVSAGVISKPRDGVKLLGGSELTTKKVSFEVNAATKGAREAVEKAGGTIKILGETPSADAS